MEIEIRGWNVFVLIGIGGEVGKLRDSLIRLLIRVSIRFLCLRIFRIFGIMDQFYRGICKYYQILCSLFLFDF